MDFEKKLIRQIILEWVNGLTPIEKVIQECFQDYRVGSRDRRKIKTQVFNFLRYRGDCVVQMRSETGFKATRILDQAFQESETMTDWHDFHERVRPKYSKSPRDHLVQVHGYSGISDIATQTQNYFDFVHSCLHSQMTQPVLTLRANVKALKNPEDLQKYLISSGFIQVPFLDGAWIQSENSPPDSLSSDQGFLKNVVFQDLSSQVVSKVVAAKKPKIILDFCCGAGIKTRQLWEETDAQIIAFDVNQSRTKPLVEWVKKNGDSRIKIVRTLDELKSFGRIFDAILLDVPCSGLGTLRRHPDVLFRQKIDQYREFESIQKSILMTAAPFLIQGGLLTYSTCTFRVEENHLQIKAFLGGSSEKWRVVSLPVESGVEVFKRSIEMSFKEGILLTPTPQSPEQISIKSQTSGTWLGDCFFIAQLQLGE